MTAPITAGESRFEAQEHRDLTIGLSRIEDLVDQAADLGSDALWVRLHDTLRWLDHDVRPHMAWEDRWLYPQLDEIAGTPWATRSAHLEHRQIERMIATLEVDSVRWLGHATPATRTEIVQHLGAIRVVIANHVEREERLLLPLLDDKTARATWRR
jgi:iron-sulfur cluster repair protein YtfE (RIC family)